MSLVTVQITTGGKGFAADIDLEGSLHFDASGKATQEVSPGRHHLVWIVFGDPGTPYTVDILTPDEAKFHLSTTIRTTSGKEIGQQPFNVA